MAALVDYFLPVEQGAVDCDPDFAHVREEQFDGVRAMVSERRVAVGLSALAPWDWTASGARKDLASMINTLRSGVEDALTLYLNTDTYSGGDLDGTTPTVKTRWTKGTLFTSAGIGDGANWSNAPGAYGSTLSSKTQRLAVHINELVLACQKLTHYPYGEGANPPNDSTHNQIKDGYYTSSVSCSDAKSTAESNYASASWAGPSGAGGWGVMVSALTSYRSSPSAAWSATLSAYRKFMEITLPLESDVTLWLSVAQLTDGLAYNPVTADGKLHLLDSASGVTSYTTPWIGPPDPLTFTGGATCPNPGQTLGWSTSGSYPVQIVVAPRFTLTG